MKYVNTKSLLNRIIGLALVLEIISIIWRIYVFVLWGFFKAYIPIPEVYTNGTCFLSTPQVSIMLTSTRINADAIYYQNITRNIVIYSFISEIVFTIILLFITIIVQKLIKHFKQGFYFEYIDVRRIKYISFAFFLWVVCDFILIMIIPLFFPKEIITSSSGYDPHYDFLRNILNSINFKILFIAFVIYTIFFVFKNRCKSTE
jgi:hypothetical protein